MWRSVVCCVSRGILSTGGDVVLCCIVVPVPSLVAAIDSSFLVKMKKNWFLKYLVSTGKTNCKTCIF